MVDLTYLRECYRVRFMLPGCKQKTSYDGRWLLQTLRRELHQLTSLLSRLRLLMYMETTWPEQSHWIYRVRTSHTRQTS